MYSKLLPVTVTVEPPLGASSLRPPPLSPGPRVGCPGLYMTVTAIPGRTGTPLNGGYGPAQAAKEALTRDHRATVPPEGPRPGSASRPGWPTATTRLDSRELSLKQMGTRSWFRRTWELRGGSTISNRLRPRRVLRSPAGRGRAPARRSWNGAPSGGTRCRLVSAWVMRRRGT